MKKILLKKIFAALALVVVVSAAFAGCGQSEEASFRQAPQSGGTESAAVPSASEDSDGVPPAEADAEGVESDASRGRDENSGTGEGSPSEAPGASASNLASAESQDALGEQALSEMDLNVRFGDDGAPFALHLYDNETAAAIARHVGTADWRLPIYHYDDYDGWEVMQYYDIPNRYEIPSNPRSVTSERAGEVYYSEPNRIILFYGDAEIPSEYTPVGYIDASEEFLDAVENNPVLEGWGNKIIQISR